MTTYTHRIDSAEHAPLGGWDLFLMADDRVVVKIHYDPDGTSDQVERIHRYAEQWAARLSGKRDGQAPPS